MANVPGVQRRFGGIFGDTDQMQRFGGIFEAPDEQIETFKRLAVDAIGAPAGSIAARNNPMQYGSIASRQAPQLFGADARRSFDDAVQSRSALAGIRRRGASSYPQTEY